MKNVGHSNKGKGWKFFQSLWLLWLFIPFGALSLIPFIYIAVRAKRLSWFFWGLFYTVPIILIFSIGPKNPAYVLILLGSVIIWIISIIHAFKIRTEFLIRFEVLNSLKNIAVAAELSEIKSFEMNQISINLPKPININTATEKEITNVLPFGPIFSKKVIEERTKIGSFNSSVQFGEVLQLKQETLKRLSPYLEFK